MIFYFASAFESGQIVEQEQFESGTFDRKAVAYYVDLINKREDFGEDLQEVHLEYTTTGPKSANIEMSSGKGDVIIYLLADTDPEAARNELNEVLSTVRNSDAPVGDPLKNLPRPLALAILPDATADVRSLSRYPIALAAAFFEAKST